MHVRTLAAGVITNGGLDQAKENNCYLYYFTFDSYYIAILYISVNAETSREKVLLYNPISFMVY